MNKILKTLLIVLNLSGFIYAQTDTTIKIDSSQTVKKAVVKIMPPTNWSKIKDLFL